MDYTTGSLYWFLLAANIDTTATLAKKVSDLSSKARVNLAQVTSTRDMHRVLSLKNINAPAKAPLATATRVQCVPRISVASDENTLWMGALMT